ncbi:MAG: zinc ribbon domain-containing protein [Caldilineaceae bacterium]
MANPARLLDLQKIDSTWEKIRRRLLQIQKLTAVPESVLALRAHFAQTESTLQEWQVKQRNAELESQTLRDRMHASEQKLMSGTVRNPKELESLQQSVDALHRQQASVEESGVLALLEVEQWAATRAADLKRLEHAEKEWSSRHTDLLTEEAKLKRHGVQLRGQRTALVAQMPAEDVALYEDLRKRKAGVAVAEVVNGACAACSVRLPTGVVSGAKAGSEVTYCPSCGRILAVS